MSSTHPSKHEQDHFKILREYESDLEESEKRAYTKYPALELCLHRIECFHRSGIAPQILQLSLIKLFVIH